MSLTSFSFILFCAAVTLFYFLVPKKYQWGVLLIASMTFYMIFTGFQSIYIVITALSTWYATRQMVAIDRHQKQYLKEHKAELTKEEKSAFKKAQARKRKAWLVGTLLLNFGILCFFKYFNFLLSSLNTVLELLRTGQQVGLLYHLIIPLGISFYTFQTMGCLIDTYWQKYEPEANFFKFLLFVSFFPQLTQGPINKYEDLAGQLTAEHKFDYHNFSYGCQRILWGYLKKMVIADRLFFYVSEITGNYQDYVGPVVLLGAFMYALQIYADFSGYMDIVCGLCQVWGIRLTENFMRPYFSKSIAEYWRRWHISLGVWFKDYIYYPIAVSGFARTLSKKGKKLFGNHIGKLLPATAALVVTWLTTGLWHGASWAYIVWGGVNGLIIIFSMQMEPLYEKTKRALRINESAWLWRAFQTLRTFLLVTLIKVFPEVGGLRDGLGFWRQMLVDWQIPTSLAQIKGWMIPSHREHDYVIFLLGALLIFVTSLIQRKQPLRDFVAKWPRVLRYALFIGMFYVILIYGVSVADGAGVFMYAQF